ncbi:MAG: hypothetical protein PHC58_01770 [Candidatus Omnitrophica bacterium]|nr:hypothetical protein [Candidatus Omnitrophota bacterium]
MLKKIMIELKRHAGFTFFGAFLGLGFLILFRNMSHVTAEKLFFVFHPAHVFFSAAATTGMYVLNKKGRLNVLSVFLVGFFGSVGIATLSDSIMPYIGERILWLPEAHAHIGFIEAFPVVFTASLLGIVMAWVIPHTKFSHLLHVFISTWASAFHVLTAAGGTLNFISYLIIFIFLFCSVWLPCCLSDIIFPLLFLKDGVSAVKKNKRH